jgi:hypothetical protein
MKVFNASPELTRLRHLSYHLKFGELAHKKFDFEVYSTHNKEVRICDSAGCALGECPGLFSAAWTWHNNNIPGIDILNSDGYKESLSSKDSAVKFFGLSREEAGHLFYPGEQDKLFAGYPYLVGGSTREEVGHHLELFIESNNTVLKRIWNNVKYSVANFFNKVIQ